jgi:putative membrane protein (TIGR04086 family)
MRKNEEDHSARMVRWGVGVILGGVVALVVCMLVLLAASVGISRGVIGEDMTYQVTVAGCLLGGFAGGLFAVRRCAARSFAAGLAAGAVLFLLLLSVGVLFFDATSPGMGGVGLLCGALCGGAAAGLVGGGKPRTTRKKRRK